MHPGNDTTAIRILLADNHPVMRIGMENLLQAEHGMEVIGETGDGHEAIAKTLALHPDILLLDFRMAGVAGLEILRAIEESPTATILLAESLTREEGIAAIELNAQGILLKNQLAECLVPAVRAVAAGSYWIGERHTRTAAEGLHRLFPAGHGRERGPHGLTPRELEIIRCIVETCSNRDIAQRFELSEETVKRHVSNIFEKTGVTTRLELALFAIEHQLVTPQP